MVRHGRSAGGPGLWTALAQYVARRLVRFANEDIGMADPHAVQQTLAAWDVYERLGTPEGELAIAQAVVYLATAPKSTAVYHGFNTAHRSARQTGSLMPPAHILNAPTRLMKNLGYSKDYQYDPDTAAGFSGANYFPDGMDRETYSSPPATATKPRSANACATGPLCVTADNAADGPTVGRVVRQVHSPKGSDSTESDPF
ncbi:hypothetical protein [Streptomyces sp. 3214.6]|uniref:AAA family ATPase n=1 Tax=Streptomyces sp. 3214.6 TaxID=1882757 RepID=UPI001E32BBB4|nr:hypothetical protein [Streptomyces sp. 3214.6]